MTLDEGNASPVSKGPVAGLAAAETLAKAVPAPQSLLGAPGNEQPPRSAPGDRDSSATGLPKDDDHDLFA
jgi:hypothetical protein